MRRLIINADDYGLNPLFDKGVLELVSKGIVTSISVMVLRRKFSAEEISKLGKLSLGLHLELGDNSTSDEIESQLVRFEKIFNRKPTHLDGHRHCHLSERNIENVCSIAKKNGIPVRSRFESDRDLFINKGLRTPDFFISWHPKRIRKLREKLDSIQDGLVEMVCHPGYCDFFSEEKYNSRREDEFNFLNSREFKKSIVGFELTDYSSV